jgi:hypothetical protein
MNTHSPKKSYTETDRSLQIELTPIVLHVNIPGKNPFPCMLGSIGTL